jgi:RNA polymerase-binding transcription factor DksA
METKKEIPEHFYVVQAKEKFGGLRFYITSAPQEVHDLIHKAEEESYHICEECGKKGTLRKDLGWWLVLCEKHYKEKKEKK